MKFLNPIQRIEIFILSLNKIGFSFIQSFVVIFDFIFFMLSGKNIEIKKKVDKKSRQNFLNEQKETGFEIGKLYTINFIDKKIYSIFPQSKNPCILVDAAQNIPVFSDKEKDREVRAHLLMLPVNDIPLNTFNIDELIFYKFMPTGSFNQKDCFWICKDYLEIQ